VLETGEAREVHHFALLIGYGCSAINPYLAFETIDGMIREGPAHRRRPQDRLQELRQGRHQGRRQGHVEDGHLHDPELPRRPGVRGVGLRQDVIDQYFTWTPSASAASAST
jgi:glutamate synthase (NADPH) large chain